MPTTRRFGQQAVKEDFFCVFLPINTVGDPDGSHCLSPACLEAFQRCQRVGHDSSIATALSGGGAAVAYCGIEGALSTMTCPWPGAGAEVASYHHPGFVDTRWFRRVGEERLTSCERSPGMRRSACRRGTSLVDHVAIDAPPSPGETLMVDAGTSRPNFAPLRTLAAICGSAWHRSKAGRERRGGLTLPHTGTIYRTARERSDHSATQRCRRVASLTPHELKTWPRSAPGVAADKTRPSGSAR